MQAAGPATSVKARVWRNAAWTTASGGIVAFDTASYGTGFNLANGVYTVPAAGDYLVHASVGTASVAAGNNCEWSIMHNATEVARGPTNYAPNPSWAMQSNVTDIVPCVAGDTLYINQGSTSGQTGATGPAVAYMTVRLLP
jgi:hypothetical protein